MANKKVPHARGGVTQIHELMSVTSRTLLLSLLLLPSSAFQRKNKVTRRVLMEDLVDEKDIYSKDDWRRAVDRFSKSVLDPSFLPVPIRGTSEIGRAHV